jgi:O-antigen/teichoic acid export membrane protein
MNPQTETPTLLSLTQKTARAAMWLGGSRVWTQIMNLTIGVGLARLLSPNDYGLLGMVTVITGLFALLSNLGLSTAVIQKQDLSSRELSSVFWFNLGLASGVALLIAGFSPLAGSFYSQPKIVPLMCVVAISFPISALASVQYALLQKEMRFKEATKIYVASSLAAGLLALLAAWAGWKVWALVLQALSASTFGALGLWLLVEWRPGFQFAFKDLERIWGFSLNLTGFQIVNYFGRNADNLLIGRFLGASQLGFYTLAYTLMVYPISNLTAVAQGVLVPAMSQIQAETKRVANAYIRACRYLAFLILPAMIGLALVAREAVLTIYGPKWDDAGRVLQILCWVGTFQPFASLVGALFVTRGFTRWFFWWGVIASSLTVLGFVIGLRWGIIGVAFSYLIVEGLLTIFGMPFLYWKVEVPVLQLLKAMALPALAAGCMGVVVFALRTVLDVKGVTAPGLILAVCVTTGCVCYGAILLLTRNYFWQDLKGEFARIFRK